MTQQSNIPNVGTGPHLPPSTRLSGTYNYEYEDRLGTWVAQRCRKRYDLKGMMPEEIITWLLTGGNSPPNGDTEATANVVGWLIKTIEDPDWPDR
ncbi:MAG: hypothetical protein PVI86_13100 [Phycisphaerae bacterium]